VRRRRHLPSGGGGVGRNPEASAADESSGTMSDATAGDRASGDFERYGLLAALTLVVLCLLVADRVRNAPKPAARPSADRLLRVRIGGKDPAAAAVHAQLPAARPAPADRTRPAAVAPVPVAPQRAPEPRPAALPRTCVVSDGETLGDIARRELGSARRAGEIAQLNAITDLDRVRAGQTLRLPPR
jgi:hypothetical protein